MVPPPGMVNQKPNAGSGQMFDQIAKRYDRLNRILSLGLDQRWRRLAVESLALPRKARVLDLATGTADLAMRIARAHPDAIVVGLDPSVNMLAIGNKKLVQSGLDKRVTLQEGSADYLPFPDESFDAVSIAFGIRNVRDRLAALREMARVTKRNGRIAILELSEPQTGFISPFSKFYIHVVVPWLGSMLSGAREYRYLQESIAAFPEPKAFSKLMRQAGLEVRHVVPLSFGVSHLFVGAPDSRSP